MKVPSIGKKLKEKGNNKSNKNKEINQFLKAIANTNTLHHEVIYNAIKERVIGHTKIINKTMIYKDLIVYDKIVYIIIVIKRNN